MALKKVLPVILIAISLSLGNVLAYTSTFQDVQPEDWYFDYVEQLVDEGVFDIDQDNFRPNDPSNRAELVKIVMVAIDGLVDYQAPATPTFDDVAPGAWYYDYVEAAFQLDIVSGYTDAAGNPTGKFGPGDTVNRAAATKIILEAFAIPMDTNLPAIFPDVQPADWFFNYVMNAYNHYIVNGYGNGDFGPHNFLTRAQAAKLLAEVQAPGVPEEPYIKRFDK